MTGRASATMGPMNKRELARAVAVQSDVDLKTVVTVIDGFTEVVTAVVSKGEPVAITGFAKFVKVNRPARMGRNPATGEAIRIKPAYGRCHPEPELALVVGRSAREIRAESAYDHVFGYTIHNDITSPTMRGEDTFHYRAIHPAKDDAARIEYVDTWVSYPGRYKNSDTFSPLGPWLVTRDEIADPHALEVSCHHKGELVTADNTVNLFYKVPEVLAFLSQFMTLMPGDVVSMGTALKRSTPGSRAVQNVELDKLGGPVSVSIAGLGTLSNPVEIVR